MAPIKSPKGKKAAAPAPPAAPAETAPGLTLLCSTRVNGTIPVHKYVSDKTGLKIVLAQVEGPLVYGYFMLGEFWSCETEETKGNNYIFVGAKQRE